MKILFIADPITNFITNHDSTWAIIEASIRAGNEAYYACDNTLGFNQQTFCSAIKLDWDFITHNINSERISFPNNYKHQYKITTVDNFDLCFMRKDPPVNIDYYNKVLLLQHCSKARIINSAHALLTINEKLSILNFPNLITETLVSQDLGTMLEFINKHQTIVLKPLDSMGGQGVTKITANDTNLKEILSTQTHYMLQKYIPAIKTEGDKRIIIINGKPRGALLRIPAEHDFRANLAAGGSFTNYSLNQRDLEICKRLEKYLIQNGIVLAGIDVIGDYLTEINITSPTCLQEINRLEGYTAGNRLEDILIKELEQTMKL